MAFNPVGPSNFPRSFDPTIFSKTPIIDESNSQGKPSSVFTTSLLSAAMLPFSSALSKQGDHQLAQARDLAIEYESVIGANDHRTIEDSITHAEELKLGLSNKSCISRFLQARVYLKASRNAYKYAKSASDRGLGMVQSQHQSEDTSSRVTRTARSLYRCYLSCKDAFPTPDMQDELAKGVWDEACIREGAHPSPSRQDEEFEYDNLRFITDVKTNIMHAVESLYGFDTSHASESIGRNASLAQALLTKTTFVYRELNIGTGNPHHPYRHPIIQRVINITWFKNKDDDGILFYDYFSPIPIEVITLALTVIECCIDEWSTGTWKETNWSQDRYCGNYNSHLNSLRDLRNHGRRQGGDLLAQIQFDLFKLAREHAGAPPEPITGAGRFPIDILKAAVEEDLPAYDQTSGTPGTTVSDE